MPYQATVYQILIASPSDVIDERQEITKVISTWNSVNSSVLHIVLLPVMWETHTMPEFGDGPQAIINKQIVEDSDILIGVFWTRIGSPTGNEESGTVEEIKKFIEMGKPVMLYFSQKPVAPDKVDPHQYARLKTFKEECKKQALIVGYETLADFTAKLDKDLTRRVRDMHANIKEPADESLQKTAAPFLSRLIRLTTEWSAERDSEEPSITSGRLLLVELDEILLDFKTELFSKLDEKTGERIAAMLKASKNLQRDYEFGLDEPSSINSELPIFWIRGGSLLNDVIELLIKESKT